jgi:hypothetical protein
VGVGSVLSMFRFNPMSNADFSYVSGYDIGWWIKVRSENQCKTMYKIKLDAVPNRVILQKVPYDVICRSFGKFNKEIVWWWYKCPARHVVEWSSS